MPHPVLKGEYSDDHAKTVITPAPSVQYYGAGVEANDAILHAVSNNAVDDSVINESHTTFLPTNMEGSVDIQALNSTSNADIVAGGASDHHSDVIVMLTYVFYALSLAALVQFLLKRLPSCIRPPYAMTLFTLGAFLSYLHHTKPSTGWALFSHSIGVVENINPEVVFFVILPPLLYESGSGLNWHVFRRLMWSAFVLAFPGVVLNLFFIGIFAWVAFGAGWTLPISLLLGSMLSTTDPVAVVAALHNLHAPDKLALLIDGESLLNDGSAIVGVLIFQNMIETGEFSFLAILDLLFRCAVGGCLFGILFAGLEVLFLKLIGKFDHSAPALEVAVVVVGMFLCYLVSDLLHMSGIIAVVSLAISMAVFGRGAFSPEGEEAVHTVVRQLAYFANQIIWLAGGHMTAAQLSQSDVATNPLNWIRMVALFLMLNIARGLSTWIMFPTLTRMGYGLNLKETIMLIYAGLRGAICIALALLIRRSHHIPEHTLNEMGFYVAGAVMLTLMVNGTTIEALYRYLRIYPKRTWAQVQLQRALVQTDDKEQQYVEALKQHWFFKHTNLQLVSDMLPQFGRAEFNMETGEVHIPTAKVKTVMRQVLERFDQAGQWTAPEVAKIGKDDNGFMYAHMTVRPKQGRDGGPVLTKSASLFDSNLTLHRSSSLTDVTVKSRTGSSIEAIPDDRTDRLVRVVQLSDTRVKAVEHHGGFDSVMTISNIIGRPAGRGTPKLSLFQSSRPISSFVIAKLDEAANPFALFEPVVDGSRRRNLPSSLAMEFTVALPDVGIQRDLMGSCPRVVVGLAPWDSEALPGEAPLSCGLYTDTKALIVAGESDEQPVSAKSDFRRDFVRGDVIRITVEPWSSADRSPKTSPRNSAEGSPESPPPLTDDTPPVLGVRVMFECGRYFVSECVLKNVEAAQLHPTVGFLVPEEQAELSFPLRTTTSAETRTESNTYLLNAAICLYEDLFKGGTLSAEALRVLCDSVQYGIDAANDDLEVRSMKSRVKTVKSLYAKNRGKYSSFEDEEGEEPSDAKPEGETEAAALSPLETEWGFIQLRHLKRVDCNDAGWRGWFLRLGEFFGVRSQYKHTYRKLEELLAYGAVHADLNSHAEMARFPDTLDLVSRLVKTSKSYLVDEVKRASPRDFYAAQHVLAAKILLHIRRKILAEFTKEGSLSQHSVKELEEHYIQKQLLALDDYTPSRPKGAGWLSAFTPPRVALALARPPEKELMSVVVEKKGPM